VNVVAYFTLTADGFLPRAEDKDLPPADNIYADTEKRAKRLGSQIVGRSTYEQMEEGESPVPIVVVSRSKGQEKDGVFYARSPREAVRLLEREGFKSTLVGGGAQIFSSFLAADLVDELYVNVAPELVGSGLRIEGPRRHAQGLKLVHTTHLEDGVVQMHYRRAA
jgi:dihydrofolate reductase